MLSFDKDENYWLKKIIEILNNKVEKEIFEEVLSLRKNNLIDSEFKNLAKKLENFSS